MSSSSSSPLHAVTPLGAYVCLFGSYVVELTLYPYVLQLRSAFGTSHSSSATRSNALLQIKIQPHAASETATTENVHTILAHSEVGLPPHKVGCYEGTLPLLQQQFELFTKFITQHHTSPSSSSSPSPSSSPSSSSSPDCQLPTVRCTPAMRAYDPFASVPTSYMQAFHERIVRRISTLANNSSNHEEDAAAAAVSLGLGDVFIGLFYLLDTYLATKQKEAIDACFTCLVENLIWNAWGQAEKLLICEMIGLQSDQSTNNASATASTTASSSTSAAAAAGAASDVYRHYISAPSEQTTSTSSTAHSSVTLPCTFYTVGIDSEENMLKNLDFGLQYTNYIKLKVDTRIEFTQHILIKILHKLLRHVEQLGVLSHNEAKAALEELAQIPTHTTAVALTSSPPSPPSPSSSSSSSSSPTSRPAFGVSIDANAAWVTPELASAYLHMLIPFAKYIIMVEQPFPLFRAKPSYIDTQPSQHHRSESESEPEPECEGEFADCWVVEQGVYRRVAASTVRAWAAVAAHYRAHRLPIYADESLCQLADLHMLTRHQLIHGINIKLEKCGGYRQALALLAYATAATSTTAHDQSPPSSVSSSFPLSTWIGCMVGSSLNSTQASHLLPFALPFYWGDLDGALLTQPTSDLFQGGMTWHIGGQGHMKLHNAAQGGSGLTLKSN